MVKLIIDNPKDLIGFDLLDHNITHTPQYQQHYSSIKRIYQRVLLLADHWDYREYQLSSSAIMASRPRNIFNYDMGTGKAQPLSSIVYCPDGPKRISDLSPGSSVLTPSGVSTVHSIHPQGLSTIYRIVFSDNSYTLCTSSHLWSVSYKDNPNPFISNTQSISSILFSKTYRSNPLSIPLCSPASFSSQPVPIPPYQLGCIISENYRTPYSISNLYSSSQLCSLGLYSLKSENKFIPKEYLYNSVSTRLLVLQGLLDSNSTLLRHKETVIAVLYTTSSKRLSENVKFLVQSLGGTCVVKKHNEKPNPNITNTVYSLTINLPPYLIPFKDPAKILDYKNVIEPLRVIKKVEEVGKEEALCIKLDDEQGLYLTDQFIVTHNTTICGLAVEHYCNKQWGDLTLAPPGSIQIFVPNLLSAQRWLQDLSFFSINGFFSLIPSKSSLSSPSPIFIIPLDLPKQLLPKSLPFDFVSDFLLSLNPHMVIIDEVHNCQFGTLRSKHLSKIILNCPLVTALSGTLSEGKLSDIHNLCSFIYPDWPYSSSSSFTKAFGSVVKLPHYLGYDSSQSKSLHRLNPSLAPQYKQLLDNFIHRLTLSDPSVSKSIRIPSANIQVSGFPPTPEQLTVHKEYVERHYTLIKQAVNAVSIRDKAQALKVIHPLILLCDGNQYSPKLEEVRRIVSNSNKTAIFTSYVKSGRLVTEFLKSIFGANTVLRLYSTDEHEEIVNCSPQHRIELVDKFMYDSNIKAGVFSIKLASESINLTSADSVIMFGLPWQIKAIKQAIYRCVRPGNTFPSVNVHFLYHYGLIDEYQVLLASEKIKSSITCENFYNFLSSPSLSPSDTSFNASSVLKNLLS